MQELVAGGAENLPRLLNGRTRTTTLIFPPPAGAIVTAYVSSMHLDYPTQLFSRLGVSPGGRASRKIC
jgi:hypothetical protein